MYSSSPHSFEQNPNGVVGGITLHDEHENCEDMARRRRTASQTDLPYAVLVADDEALIRSTIVAILKAEGYDAVAVKDGVAAVECAQRLQPDIVLADVSMPAMDGVEAAKRIRAAFPKTRIICFSGHAESSELLMQARKDGYDFEFLPKPLKPEALIRALKSRS
jgi:CheY-like chemotaxis protein